MTFYEAAVEVLRRAGRPLHYKKIAEIAVREKLLSHVGKTPQETMSSRLEQESKKNNGSVLDQIRPGVYQLDKERAGDLTEKVKKRQKEERKRRREREQKNKQQQKKRKKNDRQKDKQNGRKDSGNQDKSGGSDDGRRQSRGSKTRHKKKRKKEGDSEDSDSKQKRRKGDGAKRRRKRPSKSSADNQSAGDDRQPVGDLDISATTHLEEGPVKLKGIAEAAYKVLDDGANDPMYIEDLADAIFDRKLVKFHTHDPITTVKSALANDNQIRKQQGHRPLFEHDEEDYWWLTEWSLKSAIHQKEQAVLSLTEEIRQASVRQLGEALQEVKTEALEHLALTLLERLGYHNIKVSKRSSDGDVFFTADWRQGLADVRVCVRVVSDHNRNLDDDAVSELRETLDHYSASEGVIIHLGEITDAAVRKSRNDGDAPITLLDGSTFVELLIKYGIGVQTYESPIVTVDTDFIDALKT